MSSPSTAQAYIVAARRTALGRIGGLHRNRRLEDLVAPVIVAALIDARLRAEQVDEIVIGNASQGGNPARLIALAAGLPLSTPALTIDRQCGSGLDAILHAVRTVALGEAGVVVAGGAESLSNAPWRIAKPRSIHQLPHFIAGNTADGNNGELSRDLVASEALAQRYQISRAAQDAFAFKSHLRAQSAREARRFVGEIVPLRANREEARDESALDVVLDDIEAEVPYGQNGSTLTPANSSQPHDGAAIVVVTSEAIWRSLDCPPALRLVASATLGVSPESEAEAPIAALQKLDSQLNGLDRAGIRAIELGETSAAQAIAAMNALGIDEAVLNADGGEIVRGRPLGASGAVLTVRLFSRLVRQVATARAAYGTVALGVTGGLGMAALFEAV